MMKRSILYLFYYLICLSCRHNNAAQPEARLARNYYISNTGNDANEGTNINPWKTFARINAVQLLAGDSVFLKGSEVFEGSLMLNRAQGDDKNPVVVTSYGMGTAVIKAGNETGLQLDYCLSLEINNIIVMGSGRKGGNTKDGLAIINSLDIKLDSISITGFRNSGLAVYSSSRININRVNAYENGYAGISVTGDADSSKKSCHTIRIANCKAENNPGSPAIINNHSGNGIVAGYCTNIIIEHCLATNNGWDMPRTGNGPVGIWLFEADSSIIQYCISHHNKTSKGGEDGGGFDLDGGVTNSVIQYCESYDNQGSGFGLFQYRSASPWYNNTVRFSSSRNDGQISAAHAGVYIWNEQADSTRFKDFYFHDNVIYNYKVAAVCFSPLSIRSGFRFYNNIFTGKGQIVTNKGVPCHDIFANNKLNEL